MAISSAMMEHIVQRVALMNQNVRIRFQTIRGVPVHIMDTATSTVIVVIPNLRMVSVVSLPASAIRHAIPVFHTQMPFACLEVLVASNVKNITSTVKTRKLASFFAPKTAHAMMAIHMATVTSPRANAHSRNQPQALLLCPRPPLSATTHHSLSLEFQSTSSTKQVLPFPFRSHAPS